MVGHRADKQTRKIRVLVADDSPTIRWHLKTIIDSSPDLSVVGEARNGEEAVQMVGKLYPDIVSMDINMPRLDGLEATRQIMEKNPTPVVVVSSLVEKDIDLSFQALSAGALAVVEKPPDKNSPNFARKQRQLVKVLKAMSEVKVIKREASHAAKLAEQEVDRFIDLPKPEVIAIGASAGGPSVLSKLLKSLPPESAVPIVIVQHMQDEFIAGLARWLSRTTRWQVEVAYEGMKLKAGVVHLSPGTAHMTLIRHEDGGVVVHLVKEQGRYLHQPAIDVLFHSIARTCGKDSVGVILTGMGDDGAAGLLAMRQAGARTFAQDKASSTVYGMPNAAIDCGAVQEVLSLPKLSSVLINLL